MTLTDDELEALLERFSPGRHPKVHAALAELKTFRGALARFEALDSRRDDVDATTFALWDELSDARGR